MVMPSRSAEDAPTEKALGTHDHGSASSISFGTGQKETGCPYVANAEQHFTRHLFGQKSRCPIGRIGLTCRLPVDAIVHLF